MYTIQCTLYSEFLKFASEKNVLWKKMLENTILMLVSAARKLLENHLTILQHV